MVGHHALALEAEGRTGQLDCPFETDVFSRIELSSGPFHFVYVRCKQTRPSVRLAHPNHLEV